MILKQILQVASPETFGYTLVLTLDLVELNSPHLLQEVKPL